MYFLKWMLCESISSRFNSIFTNFIILFFKSDCPVDLIFFLFSLDHGYVVSYDYDFRFTKKQFNINYFFLTFLSGGRTKGCSCSHFCKQTGQNLYLLDSHVPSSGTMG